MDACIVEVDRRSSSVQDVLVVRTEEPRFGEALKELFYREQSGEYTKSFPPGTLTYDIYERFSSCVQSLLRQTARLDAAPWEAALRETARRLDRGGIAWWLTGSAALAVRGVDVAPRDIDLVVDDAGAATAEKSFADVLIEPAVRVEGWFCRWFGRAFVGARVEWIGGVTEAADRPKPTDFGLVAQRALDEVAWGGLTIRVPPLVLQRAVSARRGLHDRVAAIDAWGHG